MDRDRMAMSQRERDRLKVMALVLEGRGAQKEAARLLKLSVRRIRRLQRRLEKEGDGGIVHKLRGRVSNARWDPQEREKILQPASQGPGRTPLRNRPGSPGQGTASGQGQHDSGGQ